MDRLTSMSVFVRVVESGSLAAAAAEFRISATMAGKHLQSLEKRIGARLLHRTTRRQRLTEVGAIYFERCKQLLAEIEAAEDSAGAMRAAPRGVLRVTAPVAFGTHRLAPALGEFLRLYPEVKVELLVSDRLVDLVDEGFDVAIRIGNLPDSGFVARPLAPYCVVVCAAPAYLAERGAPRQPQDLERHDCIGFSHASLRWRFGDHTVQAGSRLQINNAEALRQAAISGCGIVQMWTALVEDDLRSGRLVGVLHEYERPPRAMHLVYLHDRQPAAKLQRFVEFVLARFER
ncbi:MAG: LysR family transcriptional regulator [Hydrocarboniphaga sp.]|uniref:LysR family transcriptional regulator n=1 Tax=Hydrocarboniphaga sp. TaxID=2033016 RepID=UPI002638B05D|nr:LysR family transcriptional regulator [Hydrocarboniphaga sp.]MDB5968210.1 LysR family transcriptional regulator [Hydrocarboniphaga sp.]